jgi:hypothetical protein
MRRGEEMIIRHITYHALPGKDVAGWLKSIASSFYGGGYSVINH